MSWKERPRNGALFCWRLIGPWNALFGARRRSMLGFWTWELNRLMFDLLIGGGFWVGKWGRGGGCVSYRGEIGSGLLRRIGSVVRGGGCSCLLSSGRTGGFCG